MNPYAIKILLGILLVSCAVAAKTTGKKIDSSVDGFDMVDSEEDYELLESDPMLTNDNSLTNSNYGELDQLSEPEPESDYMQKIMDEQDSLLDYDSPIEIKQNNELPNPSDSKLQNSNFNDSNQQGSIPKINSDTPNTSVLKSEPPSIAPITVNSNQAPIAKPVNTNDPKVPSVKEFKQSQRANSAVNVRKPKNFDKKYTGSDSIDSSSSSNNDSDDDQDNGKSKSFDFSITWYLLNFAVVGTIVSAIILVYIKCFKPKKSLNRDSKKIKDDPVRKVSFKTDNKINNNVSSQPPSYIDLNIPSNLKARSKQSPSNIAEGYYPSLPKDLV